MATTYNARTEYQPRTENEVLAVDPQTGQPIAVVREQPRNEVFMPLVIAIIAIIGVLGAGLVGIAMFWDLLVGLAQHPG